MKSIRFTALFLLLPLLGACSSAMDEHGFSYDPWEGYNRAMYTFNKGADTVLIKPAATLYQAITPDPIEKGVHNFFGNLGDIRSFANCLLQGKFQQSAHTLARVINNTVFGLCGFFDVATAMGLEKKHEDFGMTLAHYGVKSGPYFILPILGPSTLRDGFGHGVDAAFNPVFYLEDESSRWAITAVQGLQARADLGDIDSMLNNQKMDEYLMVRDAWLQYRRGQIYGKEAQQEDLFDYLFEDEEAVH